MGNFIYDIFLKHKDPEGYFDPDRKKHHMPNSITLMRIMIIFQKIKLIHHYII